MKKLIIILYAVIGSLSHMNAQSSEKNRLSIHAGGGLHGLAYKLKAAGSDRVSSFGYTAGLTYQRFFNARWSAGLGVGISSYKTRSTLQRYHDSYPAIDMDADPYTMNIELDGLKERQTADILEIPLTAHYEMPLVKDLIVWAGAGIQIGIPLRASYTVESGSITTSGYYEQYNWTAEDFPAHGFYTDQLSGKSADLTLATAFSGLLETGIGYKMSKRTLLTAGIYSCIGLNDINNEPGNSPGILSTEGNFNKYNGLLASGWMGPVRPFSVGMRLGIAFAL